MKEKFRKINIEGYEISITKLENFKNGYQAEIWLNDKFLWQSPVRDTEENILHECLNKIGYIKQSIADALDKELGKLNPNGLVRWLTL